eukprot:7388201-Prymnesium_polylepis.1
MVLSVGIRRRVIKVDQACDTVKAHLLYQRLVQLGAHDLRALSDLEHIVQRIGECKHRIVRERSVRATLLVVRAGTHERCVGVVVVVLRPQQVAVMVGLQVAARAVAQRRRQAALPGAEVGCFIDVR